MTAREEEMEIEQWMQNQPKSLSSNLSDEMHENGEMHEMDGNDENRENHHDMSETIISENNEEGNVGNMRRLVNERSKSGTVRCCYKCHHEKPDRSHHCRACRTCILKMDHHCPWVNNCVGFYNYKYFFLFIIYTSLASFSIVFGMMSNFVQIFDQPSGDDSMFLFGFYELNVLWAFFIAFAFGASMLLFSAYHFRLILMNMTTLESMEKQSKFWRQYQRNPYDLGVLNNLRAVLGEKWYLWLVPTYRSVPGHGTHFPIRRYVNANSRHSVLDDDASSLHGGDDRGVDAVRIRVKS